MFHEAQSSLVGFATGHHMLTCLVQNQGGVYLLGANLTILSPPPGHESPSPPTLMAGLLYQVWRGGGGGGGGGGGEALFAIENAGKRTPCVFARQSCGNSKSRLERCSLPPPLPREPTSPHTSRASDLILFVRVFVGCALRTSYQRPHKQRVSERERVTHVGDHEPSTSRYLQVPGALSRHSGSFSLSVLTCSRVCSATRCLGLITGSVIPGSRL
jgi:hypothetical protein